MKKCKCKTFKINAGQTTMTDKSNCFIHAPEAAKHNARRDKLIKKYQSK